MGLDTRLIELVNDMTERHKLMSYTAVSRQKVLSKLDVKIYGTKSKFHSDLVTAWHKSVDLTLLFSDGLV